MNISSLKLFGFRVLVERVKEKTGSIVVPDNADMMFQIGRVVTVGDGIQQIAGANSVPNEPLVAVGDLVYFQTNAVIAAHQAYEYNGESYINLHQGDLIARLKSNVINYDNFEPLGRWVMVEPFLRETESMIVLPAALKDNNSKFVYFRVAKIGSRVNLPIKPRQEVVVNTGRLGPLFIQRLNVATAQTEYGEYSYIDRDFVLGVVDEEADVQQSHTA